MIAPGILWRMIGCGALLFAPMAAGACIAPHNGVVLLPLLIGALVILSLKSKEARP